VVSKALIISYQALEPFFYPLTSVPFYYIYTFVSLHSAVFGMVLSAAVPANASETQAPVQSP
jgi:hypothetical protein